MMHGRKNIKFNVLFLNPKCNRKKKKILYFLVGVINIIIYLVLRWVRRYSNSTLWTVRIFNPSFGEISRTHPDRNLRPIKPTV